MRTSETLDLLYTALCAAQAEMPMLELNKEVKGRTYSFWYADLTEVIKKTRPCLTKHGLSISQMFLHKDNLLFLVTRLQHLSGQWQESSILITPDDNSNQSRGKAITYARRYAYACLVGVVADEDDDARSDKETDSGAFVPWITKEELATLENELRSCPSVVLETILTTFNIEYLPRLPKKSYNDVRSFINTYKHK
jgi:ERF superfamily